LRLCFVAVLHPADEVRRQFCFVRGETAQRDKSVGVRSTCGEMKGAGVCRTRH
jgi:hypothetical protein